MLVIKSVVVFRTRSIMLRARLYSIGNADNNNEGGGSADLFCHAMNRGEMLFVTMSDSDTK